MFKVQNGKVTPIQPSFNLTDKDLTSLGINKYKDFVRQMLGLNAFLSGKGLHVISSYRNNEVARTKDGSSTKQIYFVTHQDFNNLTYSDDEGNVFSAADWLKTAQGQCVLKSIQMFG